MDTHDQRRQPQMAEPGSCKVSPGRLGQGFVGGDSTAIGKISRQNQKFRISVTGKFRLPIGQVS